METDNEPPHVPQEVQGFDSAQPTVESLKTDSFELSSPSQVSEISTPDKNEPITTKPTTFKSTLQAKKRLQAYKSGSLPSSPLAKKPKLEDKREKSPAKKVKEPDEKANVKAVYVEEIKRNDEPVEPLEPVKPNPKKRSRSKSSDKDKERFKRVEKKSRNYRKQRSTTPGDTKQRPLQPVKVKEAKKPPPKKYPRDWKEFGELEAPFDMIKEFEPCYGMKTCSEPCRQLSFEGPSLPIGAVKVRTANRNDMSVPFEYIRYTKTKPPVVFSVNCTAIKESCLSRKDVYGVVGKAFVTNMEALHSDSLKFKTDDVATSKTRCWFPKAWRFLGDNDCRLLETSVGLSFLQSYTAEDEGGEIMEEEIVVEDPRKEAEEAKTPEIRAASSKPVDKKKGKKDHVEDPGKKKKKKAKDKRKSTDDENDVKKKKKRKKDKAKKSEKAKKEKTKKSSEGKSEIDEDKSVKNEERSPQNPSMTPEKETVKKSKSIDRDEDHKRVKKSRKSEENEVREKKDRDRSKTPKRLVNQTGKRHRSKEKKSSKTPEILTDPVKKSDRSDKKSKTSLNDSKDETPDTDEYHSHWESDDGVPNVPAARKRVKKPIKVNRSWESDEELFERTYNRSTAHSNSYEKLEMPLTLTINSASRRRSSSSVKNSKWDAKTPYVDVESEMKLLEEERRTLTEERRQLEIEKAKVLKLQVESGNNREVASSTPPDFDLNRVKAEKSDATAGNDFTDSMNNSLLSNVSSMESPNNFPALENEYEEFMRAVGVDSPKIAQPPPTKKKKAKEAKVSSSDLESSSSSSSSSDSDAKKRKRRKSKKKKKRKVKNIFDEFDIPVPSDLPDVVADNPPLPVPSPAILPLTCASSCSSLVAFQSVLEDLDKGAEKPPETPPPPPSADGDFDLSKSFVFPTITISPKKPLLVDNSKLKLDDDSDSADFTEKFAKKPEEPEEPAKPVEAAPKIAEEDAKPPREAHQKVAAPEVKVPSKVSTDKDRKKKDPRRRSSPGRKRDSPPSLRRRPSPRRRFSPCSRRRRSPSPRRRSPNSPRRRSLSPRRRSITPRRRSLSPRRRSPPRGRRYRSPRRSPSPRGGRKRSLSPLRPRRGGGGCSPLHSPLDGFKRSVADSTISDDMLPQPSPKDYSESPPTFRNSRYYPGAGGSSRRRSSLSPTSSPKRLSLDDRINQVLGLEQQQKGGHHHHHHHGATPQDGGYHHHHYNYPPPPSSSQFDHHYGPYSHHYGHQYGGQKGDYGSGGYNFPPPIAQTQQPVSVKQAATKVVQIGNILQVVPNDEVPQTPIDSNKIPEVTQKIVQVGNMLQIVPAPLASKLPSIQSPSIAIANTQKQSAEAALKLKIAERKAEREKRRLEREKRRKDKERKRKEKDRRKQMKLKLKTENMIKKALQLEGLNNEDAEEEVEDEVVNEELPQVQVVVSPSSNGSTTKGILISGKGDKSKVAVRLDKKKSVQFADGVRPGEGTSPSGGEELSSPPPVSAKLPKERRFKKLKIPKKSKKKKIKVKVVKKVAAIEDEDDDDEEEDLLPPPSPPPGSPPPHVFPSRVKTHTINNVHQYVVSGPGPYVQQFRPPMPVVINRGAPAAFLPGAYHPEVHNLPHTAHHPTYPGGLPGHRVSSHH